MMKSLKMSSVNTVWVLGTTCQFRPIVLFILTWINNTKNTNDEIIKDVLCEHCAGIRHHMLIPTNSFIILTWINNTQK